MGRCFSKIESRRNINGYLVESTIFINDKTQIFLVEKDGNLYALKEVDITIPDNEDNYFRELFNIRQFTHPNVLKFYDDFIVDKNYYLVLEYIKGVDLFDYIQEYTLTEKQIKYLMLQIVCGLHYIHSKNVAHLDLKLDNILLNPETNQIKICDFGFAADEEMIKVNRGTPEYIAPEAGPQTLCDPKKLDIWSLGICFYILITRTFPFDGDDKHEIFEKVKTAKIDFEKIDISFQGRDLLIQMLNRNPDDRPSIDQVMIHEWFHFT